MLLWLLSLLHHAGRGLQERMLQLLLGRTGKTLLEDLCHVGSWASDLFHDGRGKAAGAIQAFLGDKAITGSRVEDTIKSRRLYNSGHDS